MPLPRRQTHAARPLANLFGSTVRLADGRVVTADEAYLRESILNPAAKVVAGFQPVMPTYQGQLTEEQVFQLIEYIKSLSSCRRDTSKRPAPAANLAQRHRTAKPRSTLIHHASRIYHDRNYLNVDYRFRSWLLTTDHKRIAILYMISVTLFFFVGGAAAVLFRLELMTPRGDLVIAETYNKLFTLHGVIMVFFFLIPSIPAVLGNFLLPMMIGARDLAFPAAEPGELVHLHDGRR